MDDLADISEDLVEYLKFYVGGALHSADPGESAGAADAACTYYQGVAICELLLDAEVEAFFHHMTRSGRIRRWLLRKSQGDGGYPAKVVKASNTRGLFAALVANDWSLARDIAALSSPTWNERVEYEEDFRYAHFIHGILKGDDEAAATGLLGEYLSSLDGDESPRYRLCASLLASPAEAPALALGAFADLLAARREELQRLRATSILATDELFGPFSAIYVEGLAWLRLLDQRGIMAEAEYVYCPSLARSTRFSPAPAEGFPP